MATKLYRKGTKNNVNGIECEVRLFTRGNPLSFVGVDGWCAKPEDVNGIAVSDPDDLEGYNPEQIREKAKDSGIDGWEKKRITTLIEVLRGKSS